MLILSRKIGEEIEVFQQGKRIGRIVLVNYIKGQARIGLEFDRDIEFVRDDAIDRGGVPLAEHEDK